MRVTCCGADCPGGHFIPSITYGLAGHGVSRTWIPISIRRSMNTMRALHVPDMHLPPVPRRSVHAARGTGRARVRAAEQPQAADVLGAHRGRRSCADSKSACCSCAPRRSTRGMTRSRSSTDGLVRGMNLLGEDFSANRAFVPEMLIAARCMAAATELLKPHHGGGRAARRSAASVSARCAAICTTSARTSSRS